MADCVTVGTDYVVQVTYRDADGTLTTPTTYDLDYKDPSDNETTITQGNITAVSTGVLRVGIPTDEVGVWNWRLNAVVAGDDVVTAGVFCVKGDGFS